MESTVARRLMLRVMRTDSSSDEGPDASSDDDKTPEVLANAASPSVELAEPKVTAGEGGDVTLRDHHAWRMHVDGIDNEEVAFSEHERRKSSRGATARIVSAATSHADVDACVSPHTPTSGLVQPQPEREEALVDDATGRNFVTP